MCLRKYAMCFIHGELVRGAHPTGEAVYGLGRLKEVPDKFKTSLRLAPDFFEPYAKISSKNARISLHERSSVCLLYANPGTPRLSASGLVKL
jgi:hypothetical protein